MVTKMQKVKVKVKVKEVKEVKEVDKKEVKDVKDVKEVQFVNKFNFNFSLHILGIYFLTLILG